MRFNQIHFARISAAIAVSIVAIACSSKTTTNGGAGALSNDGGAGSSTGNGAATGCSPKAGYKLAFTCDGHSHGTNNCTMHFTETGTPAPNHSCNSGGLYAETTTPCVTQGAVGCCNQADGEGINYYFPPQTAKDAKVDCEFYFGAGSFTAL